MAIGDRIRKRREENGWTPEDFAKAKARREAIWGGIKTVAAFVPAAAPVAAVVDTAVETGRAIKQSKKPTNIGTVLGAADDVVAKAMEVAVADTAKPEFTADTAALLTDPMVRVAMDMAQKVIDELEERMKIDIPDEMEKAILDSILDVMDDAVDYLQEEAVNIGKKWLVSLGEWIKGLFAKKNV